MPNQLISLLETCRRPRLLLVGDVMLDRYLWGDVERISPEAPTPVLSVSRQEHRLGGAGSVAAMLAALDCRPILVAVTGDDAEAATVRDLLDTDRVDHGSLLTDPSRVTTLKERLLGRAQQRYPHHMMRVDRESAEPVGTRLSKAILAEAARHIDQVDLVVISDYGKGVCAGEMIPRLVALARRAGVGVLADPLRATDYHRYAGCACITPNRTEAASALGRRITSPQHGLEAARQLLDFGVEAAAVTLDRDGIAWADSSGNAQLFPGRPREVSDITGAGDMVLSALAYALAHGADHAAAVTLANLAGGLEVERLGVVPLSRGELLDELSRSGNPAGKKILPLGQAVEQLRRRGSGGEKIVMTNGCFDLLHPGHVASLQAAARQGDCLVVGLNSDRSVRELKGPARPIVDQQGRAEMLAALDCVDYVVLFDEASVGPLVEAILPDVLCKSDDYSLEQIAGRQCVERRGGRVVLVPMKSNYSTTGLIDRIRGLPRRRPRAA